MSCASGCIAIPRTGSEGWTTSRAADVRPKTRSPATLSTPRRNNRPNARGTSITRALTQVAQGAAALLYLDECDLHLLPVLRAMWMKGPRLRIPTPGQNARHAFFGALDAASGVFHWTDQDRKLARHFVAFLDYLATVYPTGPLFLVLDGAPTHTAKVVQKWLAAHPQVHLLWLPKYAAHNANPAERIWGLMKDNVAANRLAGSIGVLVAAARRFFGGLAPHPVALPVAA